MYFTHIVLQWLLFFHIIFVPLAKGSQLHVELEEEGCIVRCLQSIARKISHEKEDINILFQNGHGEPALVTTVFGDVKFFTETYFGQSFKTRRLSCNECNIFLLPPSLTFYETAQLISSSGFIFTEKAWFISINDGSSTAVFQMLHEGVDAKKDFPLLYVKLLFILKGSKGVQVFCYCWLCQSSERFQPITLSRNAVVNEYQSTKLHQRLNWDGHGTMSNLVASVKYHTLSDSTKYCLDETTKMKGICRVESVPFSILWVKLNVSSQAVKNRPSDEEFDHTLYIVMDGREDDLDSFDKFNPMLTIASTNDFQFVYWAKPRHFIKPDWEILIKPLDPFVWLLWLAAVLVFMIYKKKQRIQSALDILQLAVLQGIGWHRFSRFLLFFSLLLVILANGYLGVVTSLFMKRPKPERIELLRDLFESGYRYVGPKKITDMAELGLARVGMAPVEKLTGMNMTLKNFLSIENFGIFALTAFQQQSLFDKRGFIDMQVYRYDLSRMLGVGIDRIIEIHPYRCFLLRKDQSLVLNLMMSFQLYMSNRADFLRKLVIQSGIQEFWGKARWWRILQTERELQVGLYKGLESRKMPTPIPLESHVQIFFYFWMIGLAFGTLSFLRECFSIVVWIWTRRMAKISLQPQKSNQLKSQVQLQ